MRPVSKPVAHLLTHRFLPTVLTAYLALRMFTTVLLVWMADHEQDPVIFTGEHPRYFDMAVLWDGQWYQRIAEGGYPDRLPVDDAGQLQQNEWAFYPMFPMLARALMALTGLGFEVAGPVVATVLGFAAAAVMAVLLRDRVGPRAALAGVCLWAAFPASPALQIAYSESLALLLLCAFLLALGRERWLLAALCAALTGLARPIALPLGLVALVAMWLRWRRRSAEPVGAGEGASMLAALAGCGLSGLMWPAIAWWATGSPSAYTDTMTTWRADASIVPFEPLWEVVRLLFGPTWGPVWLLVVAALLLVTVLGPWARALGPELRAWSLAYPFYLAAALDPWTSIYRYLLPLFPVFVVLVGGGWRPGQRPGAPQPAWQLWLRTGVVVVLFLGWQVWWVWELLRFVPPTDNPP